MHHQGTKGVTVSPLSSNTENNEHHHLKKIKQDKRGKTLNSSSHLLGVTIPIIQQI